MPFFVFPTSIGHCGIAWDNTGVTAFLLPEQSEESTRRHLAARYGDANESASLPAEIADLVHKVQDHLTGNCQTFCNVSLAWDNVSPFRRRVYEAAAQIPPGQAITYGELAARIGAPRGSARAIGGAMASNPWPLIIPCHRVVGANGKLTGFSGFGGTKTKARLLAIEGAALRFGD